MKVKKPIWTFITVSSREGYAWFADKRTGRQQPFKIGSVGGKLGRGFSSAAKKHFKVED